MEPISLDRLTMHPASERRSRGSMALVTAKTPNTLVSKISRMSSSATWLGGAGIDALGAQVLDSGLAPRLVACTDEDGDALSAQLARDFKANTLVGSGDERNLADF